MPWNSQTERSTLQVFPFPQGSVMRSLAVALLVAFTSPVPAAEKNEDKAKEAAVAFLKAVKSKDVDAVMKVSAAPFAYRDGDKPAVLKAEAAIKTWGKERLEEIKDADKIPTEIEKIVSFAEVKEKIKDEADRKTVEDVVGKDGFVAIITADDKMIPIFVRIKDGKAKVVGIAR